MNNQPRNTSHLRLAPTPEEQRSEHRTQQFKTARKWAGGLAVTGALVFGAIKGVQLLNDDFDKANARAQLTYATAPEFTDVSSLRAHGACAPELLAEASYADAEAKAAKNSSWEKTNIAAAARFRTSAQLAAANDIDCAPQEQGATSLTLHFDVPALQETRYCSQEVRADIVDPNTLNNEANRRIAGLNNEMLLGLAALAEQFQVPCE